MSRLALILTALALPLAAQDAPHVFGAKTARPYTLDDFLYGRKITYEMAEFRKTPNGPNTPGSNTYRNPIEPFKIAGNTYYVGVNGQGSYLINTSAGLILIEQPYDRATGDNILASIKKLGFNPADIKVMTASEYHFDHMGATAYIKDLTNAQLMIMEGDAELVEKGTGIPAVKVDRVLRDRDQIRLGETTITAYHIPGHTPGATTFMWQVTESGQKYNMAEVCCWSNQPPSQNLVSDPLYPTTLLRHNFEVLMSLPVDIPTPGAHSDHFNIQGKLARMKANPKVNPWIAPQDYRGVIAYWEWAFEQEVLKQLKDGPPAPGAGRGGRAPGQLMSFPPFPDHP
jgi:metallo-beta-lactamase class B